MRRLRGISSSEGRFSKQDSELSTSSSSSFLSFLFRGATGFFTPPPSTERWRAVAPAVDHVSTIGWMSRRNQTASKIQATRNKVVIMLKSPLHPSTRGSVLHPRRRPGGVKEPKSCNRKAESSLSKIVVTSPMKRDSLKSTGSFATAWTSANDCRSNSLQRSSRTCHPESY